MTYTSGGLIQASDYNSFVSAVNSVWGTGSGDTGYGQSSPLTTVAASATITASHWNTLITRINTIRQHQTGSSSGITIPTSGTTITHLPTLASTVSALTTNRLVAAATDPVVQNTVTVPTGGFAFYSKEITMTWDDAASMRYWFNAGGSIGFTASESALTSTTVATEWDTLLSNCGTVFTTAQSSTRTNGTGTPTTLNTNLGFYDLTTSYQTILDQSRIASGYNLQAVFQAKLNASPGSSTVLTLKIQLTDNSGALAKIVSGSLRFDYVYYAPSSTYLSNTWGSVTVNTNLEAASVQWLGAIGSVSSAATQPFNNIVVPDGGLLVFAPVGLIGGGESRTINSMTVGGSSVPVYGPNPNNGAPIRWGAMHVAAGTYDVTVSFPNVTGYGFHLGVWLLRGLASHVPYDTDYIFDTNPMSRTMSYPTGNSFGLFAHYHWTITNTTWTNAVEEFESFSNSSNNTWSRTWATRTSTSSGDVATSVSKTDGSLAGSVWQ